MVIWGKGKDYDETSPLIEDNNIIDPKVSTQTQLQFKSTDEDPTNKSHCLQINEEIHV